MCVCLCVAVSPKERRGGIDSISAAVWRDGSVYCGLRASERAIGLRLSVLGVGAAGGFNWYAFLRCAVA